jgi:hypothetical protein
MTLNEIKTILVSEKTACSIKQIANLAGIDATSEVLREMKDTCFDAVECGELRCLTIVDTGKQFFAA